jgi:hypothetical protein
VSNLRRTVSGAFAEKVITVLRQGSTPAYPGYPGFPTTLAIVCSDERATLKNRCHHPDTHTSFEA